MRGSVAVAQPLVSLPAESGIAPNSKGFRYAENRDPETTRNFPVLGQMFVDLLYQQDTMRVLDDALAAAGTVASPWRRGDRV